MSNYTKATNFASKDALPTGNALKTVSGTEIDDEFSSIQTSVATKANLSAPTFTGIPAAPTAATATNSTQIATTAFTQAAIVAGVAAKAPIDAPTFTGVPAAPTAAVGTDTTQLATTEFANAAVAALVIPAVTAAVTATAARAPAQARANGNCNNNNNEHNNNTTDSNNNGTSNAGLKHRKHGTDSGQHNLKRRMIELGQVERREHAAAPSAS